MAATLHQTSGPAQRTRTVIPRREAIEMPTAPRRRRRVSPGHQAPTRPAPQAPTRPAPSTQAPQAAPPQAASPPTLRVETPQHAPNLADQLWLVWHDFRSVRIATVAVAIAVLALLAWLVLIRPAGDGSTVMRPGAGPVTTSQADLAALSTELGHPIYWVGPRPGMRFESSLTSAGDVDVQYLAANAVVGDPSPSSLRTGALAVATHPVFSALASLRAYARRSNTPTTRLPGGGMAITVAAAPGAQTRVVFAYPGQNVQGEVSGAFDGTALATVESGDVTPVG
jgi:hypothetical protein